MGSQFQSQTGIQATGIQGTPSIALTPAQVPSQIFFEREFERMGGAIFNAYKQTKQANRVLEYTKAQSNVQVLDKEYDLVSRTINSKGNVVNLEGQEVVAKEYVNDYTQRKRQVLETFDSNFNDPILFKDDQLFTSTKAQIETLPQQEKMQLMGLSQQTTQLQVADSIAAISNNDELGLQDKLVSIQTALNASPVQDQQRVQLQTEAFTNAVNSSIRTYQHKVENDRAYIEGIYKDDPQEMAEQLLAYDNSEAFKMAHAQVLSDIETVKNYDLKLADDFESVISKIDASKLKQETGDLLRVGEFNRQAKDKQRQLILGETNAVVSISYQDPDSPLIEAHIQSLKDSKAKATDAQKLVIQEDIDLISESQRVFKKANGSALNIDVRSINNPSLAAKVFQMQQMEQNKIERERKAAEKGRTVVEDKIINSFIDKGYLDDRKQQQLLRQGATPQMMEMYKKQYGASPVSPETLSAHLLTEDSPSSVFQKLGVDKIPKNGTGLLVVNKALTKAYGVSERELTALGIMSESVNDLGELAKSYGQYAKSITFDRNSANYVTDDGKKTHIDFKPLPLVTNRLSLSDQQIYKALIADEVRKNPNQDNVKLQKAVESRLQEFSKGVLNKAKEEANAARNFNPAQIVPANIQNLTAINFSTRNSDGSTSTDLTRQTKGAVAFVRGLNHEVKKAGLSNTGLTVTSMYRGSVRGHRHRPRPGQVGTFHQDPNGVALDIVTTSQDKTVIGKQLHASLLALSKSVKSDDYEIAGNTTKDSPSQLFSLARQINKTGAIPSEFATGLTASQMRFMINVIKKSRFIQEKKTAGHLHLSGLANKSGTSEYYNVK